MAEIVLVRVHEAQPTEAEKEAARKVLFGNIDGLGERGKKQWRRFINGLFKLEHGEMVTIKTNKARSGPYHRRHMKMEQVVFEAQERFDNFDKGFRDWLKVGAGHCDWHPGPKGGVFPVPKSISYADMEELEMREFHDKAIDFLRTPHALKTLWPALPEAQRVEMMETILSGFGE